MKAITLALAFIAVALPSHAQNLCADHSRLIEALAGKYGETLIMAGLTDSGSVVEVFASEETGTWSVLTVTPDGQACFIAAGGNFISITTPPTPKGDPA